MSNLSIIVPYRDRLENLSVFLGTVPKYIWSPYEIVIVEQDDDNPFNFGSLANIGVLLTTGQQVCFHCVDNIPMVADYSFVHKPTIIATEVEQFGYQMPYDEFFGCVTIFPREDFYKIGGYSNNFNGWGGDDDNLYWRCRHYGITPDKRYGRFASLQHPVNTIRSRQSIAAVNGDVSQITMDMSYGLDIKYTSTLVNYLGFRHYKIRIQA